MLSKFRHSHIVSLLGYYEEYGQREMILVYEYMPNGSLDDHLHKKRATTSKLYPLTWIQRLHICIGAARGLDYLHTGTGVQSRVIHRDIKSSNILLDENLAAKISDFGVSRIGPAYHSGTTTNVFTNLVIGTFGYMDAEYFATHRLTRKSDVYAFGVVLFQVLCGRPALDFTLDEKQQSLAGWAKQCVKEGHIGRIIDPCLRGQVSAKCLKEFGKIAYECLLSSSKHRPTMTKVLARLELVLMWTLQNQHSASDRKHIGRTTFIDKAWSLLPTKAPIHMSSDTKKLGQSNENKIKGIMIVQHATKVAAEGGCHSGGIATTSPEVVSPIGQTKTPSLKRFTFSELKIATRNFQKDSILGEGGFGKVYKGWLDTVTYAPCKPNDGSAVAIKKLNPGSAQGFTEWQAEVNFLGKFSHPNLVKLLGHCQEDGMFLLVYEYIKKGSLENHLFKKVGEPLPWYTRIKIAMGAAQGLAFLHSSENTSIFRDVKSSSILLDEDFNARLSDFGLVRLGPDDEGTHVSTRVVGTYGYTAPEYIITGRLYVKSDVYGFGVVMLEIITGLRVIDHNRPARERNLVEWARPFFKDKKRFISIMYPRLDRVYPSKGAWKTVELILSCLQYDPNKRPSMEEVVSCLRTINAIQMRPKKLLRTLDLDSKNQSCIEEVSSGLQGDVSEMNMKSTQSNVYTGHSMNLDNEQGRRGWYTSTRLLSSPFRSKQGKRASYTSTSRLFGLRKWIGSKKDRAQTETTRTKTENLGN